MASAVLRFLVGDGRDGAGRTLAEVLAFDDAALEQRHDFIQWLFPLPEASQAVAGSPVLGADDIAQLRRSEAAQLNLRAAAARMAHFYAAHDHWLVDHDHNHLRITRIIRSLRLLIGDGPANQFRNDILARVRQAGAPVNALTLRYWSKG